MKEAACDSASILIELSTMVVEAVMMYEFILSTQGACINA
jgi:hypothetical protein